MSGTALSPNQSYLVTVQKGGSSSAGAAPGSNAVQANSMAKLNIEIQNHWVNVLEALGLSGGGGSEGGGILQSIVKGVGQAASAAQIFSGNNFLPNIATSHVWRGSTGIQLSLQMRFDAWSDPIVDVSTPVQKLIAMFMPIRGSTSSGDTSTFGYVAQSIDVAGLFLHPPGPTPYDYLHGDTSNMFTVMIGTNMVITNLIPTAISWEFEERYDANGNPMAAMVTLGFISFTTPDANEVLSYFRNNGQTGVRPIGSTGLNSSTSTPSGPNPMDPANIPPGSN